MRATPTQRELDLIKTGVNLPRKDDDRDEQRAVAQPVAVQPQATPPVRHEEPAPAPRSREEPSPPLRRPMTPTRMEQKLREEREESDAPRPAPKAEK
jgi:hypothetical protein